MASGMISPSSYQDFLPAVDVVMRKEWKMNVWGFSLMNFNTVFLIIIISATILLKCVCI